MTQNHIQTNSKQAIWSRFRFSVVGLLLSSPPKSGELNKALRKLSDTKWQHPITGATVTFSFSTIQRWYYKASQDADPIKTLRPKRRADADHCRQLKSQHKSILTGQYQEHPSWSYRLHADNLAIQIKNNPDLAPMPSYSTVLRYMKGNGYRKKTNVRRHGTVGAEKAAARLETREVRSFEVDYVNSLWHLDFHHGRRKVLTQDGKWQQPILLAIMDDRSRIICHIQWYLAETAETLVHGFIQALQKRGLPRALMTDNGSAMVSAEFTEGLERLSIIHQTTLPYSPYQNAKQEVLWAQVEGRLMAMLEGEKQLTLSLLNEATIAWAEYEYHRKSHSEINDTPINRYLKDTNVSRTCPETTLLRNAFCHEVKRRQRKSDCTFSLDGKRFEVPSQYRHIDIVHVRYARWDLTYAILIDPKSDNCIARLYPQDKSANANSKRRAIKEPSSILTEDTVKSTGIAPLLKDLMAQYAATGLPPAYISKIGE